MKKSIKSNLSYLVFFTVVASLGMGLTNPYYFQVLTFIGINTLLAVGLNMLMGYAGQISLGHAAFFGIGAYASGILNAHYGWSPWLSGPAALVLAGVVAYLVGLPTLKLTGYYLAMGTLGFGMIVNVVLNNWSAVTGGSSGLYGMQALSIGSVSLTQDRNGFLFIWFIVIAAFFFCSRIVNSRIGRALRAIHYSEKAAMSVGVDTARVKLQIFVLSAVLAALAGFFYAHSVMFISPGSFSFLVSVRLVAMVVIGGMASIWGALLGAGLLTLLPELLHAVAEYEMAVYGFILIVVMIFFPEGLVRGIISVYERARDIRKRPDSFD
ncbi:MAG: branched-chain amino acid ABC transporter permease [Deltaproteobacteria bacterium]|nr:branched-chain amino acid ABC transporter permease [Deltaproteobacteria bacterium]